MKLEAIKKDKGYHFPQLGIHMVAKTKEKAIKKIEKYHGVNIEKRLEAFADQERRAEERKKRHAARST